jgi:hypothetical protein
MTLSRFVLLVLATTAGCGTLPRPEPATVGAAGAVAAARVGVRAGVRAALDSFIVDFNALDSARFESRWAEEASATLPFPDTPERLDGRDAVLARFRAYFAQVRRERSGPPFLRMVLEDVRIDLLADDVAVVTYAFPAGGRPQRRTLVMVRAHGHWRIAHMHGSAAVAP